MFIIKNAFIAKPWVLLLFVLYFISSGAWSACTGSSPNLNSSPDEASVKSCVGQAKVGDTIHVDAGNATWAAPIEITHGLSMIGAGIGKTVIISKNGHIFYQPADWTANSPFRISGFTFDLGGASSATSLDLGAFHGKRIPYTPFTVQTKVRVDHVRITNGAFDSTAAHAFKVSLAVTGVADNNVIDGFRLPIDAFGGLSGTGPSYGGKWSWDNIKMDYGRADENFMYEDNVFTFGHSGEADASLTQCEFSGRYSLRYNTINSLTIGQPILDLHGNAGTSADNAAYSCFGGELYGNLVNAKGYWLNHRGGKFLSFYNSFPNGSSIIPTEEYPDNGLPATPRPQHVNDSYYWNNREGSGGVLPISVTTTIGGVPALNKDFWSDVDGSPGVRCGTASARPGNCTVGQGYWQTTQSCTDLNGLVGDINTFPNRKTITGTLYKCTAPNTWTSYYEPLDYPHPLRTGDAPSTGGGAGGGVQPETILPPKLFPPSKP